MDILYEESAVNSNAQKAEKRYRIINIFSKFFGVLAIIFAVILFFNLLTFLFSFKGMTAENRGSAIALLVLLLFLTTLFGGPWLACFLLKRRTNLSYDYTFVSGELRISKVFNVNRRKFLHKIQPESILKLGDADSPSFARVCADPTCKQVVCTPNAEPAEGKFFLYIQTSEPIGKRVYILECREELLVNILKFVKRGILESDYVMQEKKKSQR